jgi:hypothetical protein
MSSPFYPFIPAKAGTQAELAVTTQQNITNSAWVPAFAGMSGTKGSRG